LQTTVALRLPEQWLYAIVPVTMALCALHILMRIIRRMSGLPKVGA
jgi:TRAP-type C4-dicarboxylate transport system permease small subunit